MILPSLMLDMCLQQRLGGNCGLNKLAKIFNLDAGIHFGCAGKPSMGNGLANSVTKCAAGDEADRFHVVENRLLSHDHGFPIMDDQ